MDPRVKEKALRDRRTTLQADVKAACHQLGLALLKEENPNEPRRVLQRIEDEIRDIGCMLEALPSHMAGQKSDRERATTFREALLQASRNKAREELNAGIKKLETDASKLKNAEIKPRVKALYQIAQAAMRLPELKEALEDISTRMNNEEFTNL